MKNPIVNGWYADPEARVYDGRIYIYLTKSLPFEEQLNLDLAVGNDTEHFEIVHDILDISTFNGVKSAVWAPTVIKKGSKYYIVFAANNIHEDNEPGGLYIGVSDTPYGKFKNVFPDGMPIINVFHNGAQPIDPHFFLDSDGTVYLYYGGWRRLNVCRMNENMTGFETVAGYNGTAHAITPENYVEAPFVMKFGETYSMMYSSGSWADGSYRVKAAISDSPIGTFTYKGDVMSSSELFSGPGHNSAFEWNGKLYTAYHRRAAGDKNHHHRVLCIDEISVKDGIFMPVKMT